MTITPLGSLTVGATLSATTAATAAVSTSVGAAMPEVSAKLDGYILASVPSIAFDMAAQVALTVGALVAVKAEILALPGGVGAGLVAALEAGIAAQALAQAGIKTASPALALKVDSALAGKASLDVQASAGVVGPNVNGALVLKMIDNLGKTMAALQAQLDFAAGLSASLGAGGLRVYRFDGDISTAGAELQAQITADSLSGEMHFVVMLPDNPAAWTALQATVKTS